MNELIRTISGTDKDFLLYERGVDLTDKQASLLEAAVEVEPSNAASRVELLGYYTEGVSKESVAKWMKHMVWLILNCPGGWITGWAPTHTHCSSDQIQHLVETWASVLELNPDSGSVCGRAAVFFTTVDNCKAERLFEKAIELEPTNEAWHIRLANLKIHQIDSAGENQIRAVEKALSCGNKALKVVRHRGERNGLLMRLCNVALTFDELDQATVYARSLMDLAREIDLNFRKFEAHCLLGRIALKRGKIGLAKAHLARAGRHGFFNDMSLARELVLINETDTVLKFLSACLPSAGQRQAEVATWIEQLERGEIPTFD